MEQNKREILISFNPQAGRGRGKPLIQDLEGLLSGRGFQVRLIDSLEQLSSYTKEHKSRIHAVVAAGGDGTIEAVSSATEGKLPIAIFPLGTENLMAKFLKIEAHPRRLVESIAKRQIVKMDTGLANDKPFSIVLSSGYDAEVVRLVHERRKASSRGNITHLAYAQPIIQSVWNYDFPGLIVEWKSGDEWEQRECHWAFIFNMPTYAAGLRIVSHADPTDGMLDIATFTGGSLWKGFQQFGSVVLGQQHSLTGFQQNRSNHIRIRPVEQNDIAFQFDGDPGGVLPVEIKVLPKHLPLIVDDTSMLDHHRT